MVVEHYNINQDARLTIDSNGTGGGNQAQTGLTILPFNNTNLMVIILETISILPIIHLQLQLQENI